jgi:hypothetical protein
MQPTNEAFKSGAPTISICFQENTLSLVRLVGVRNVMLQLYNQDTNGIAVVYTAWPVKTGQIKQACKTCIFSGKLYS